MVRKLSKTRFFLVFILLVLIYFSITYTVVNRETLSEQFDVIKEGGSFFAKTATYRVLHLNKTDIGFDKSTYEIELIIFEEINEVRQDSGLNKLKWDPALANVARKHSLDMATNQYLNHTNLAGLDPTGRAELEGLKTKIETKDFVYIGIGENIGLMPKGVVKDVGVLIRTKDIASAMVYKWMLSEPHKKNILDKTYQFTGIGVTYDGHENFYITQNFQ